MSPWMISTWMVQEILHNKISNLMDQIIYHKSEQGKGVALLLTGFAHATGDLVIIQDAEVQ